MMINIIISVILVLNFVLGDYLNHGAGDSGLIMPDSFLQFIILLVFFPILVFLFTGFMSIFVQVFWNYSVVAIFETKKITFKTSMILGALILCIETLYIYVEIRDLF
jgi:hypothetical protein